MTSHRLVAVRVTSNLSTSVCETAWVEQRDLQNTG